jgi:hypothetical protein
VLVSRKLEVSKQLYYINLMDYRFAADGVKTEAMLGHGPTIKLALGVAM